MKKQLLSLLLTGSLLLSALPGTCAAYDAPDDTYQTISGEYPVMSADNFQLYPNIMDQLSTASFQELTSLVQTVVLYYGDNVLEPKYMTDEDLYDIAACFIIKKVVPSSQLRQLGPSDWLYAMWQVNFDEMDDIIYHNLGRHLNPSLYRETQALSDWEIYEKYAHGEGFNMFVYGNTLHLVVLPMGIDSYSTEIQGVYDLGGGKYIADIMVYDEEIEGHAAAVFQMVNGHFRLQKYYPMSYMTFAIPPEVYAAPTTSKVLVNGKQVEFEAYNIQDNNYFKLRDIAQAITGTEKQFEVTWDAGRNAINLVSGQPYTAAGGELTPGDGMEKDALPSTAAIYQDGEKASLTAYTIAGNNYFKLRDLGQAFDFQVSWDAAAQCVVIDTTASYTIS